MRKMYVKAVVRLIIEADEDAELSDIMDELEVFTNHDEAEIMDFSVENYEVEDSK